MTGRPEDQALMTGSYALDALDDAERQAVEAAMADSAEMRAEADSLRQTALLLAYAAPAVEPSAALKTSLMAKIATTPQLPALSGAPVISTDLPSEHPLADDTVAPVSGIADGSARSRARARWFQRPAMVLSAAAAAVVIFGGAGLGFDALTRPEQQGQGQTQQTSAIDRIMAAADFRRSTTDVASGGTATVVWSDKLGKSAVILKGVQAPPAGKTYELWYIGSQPKAAGLVDVKGHTTSAVLEGTKAAGDTVGITLEPKGGSEQPTTEPIAAVTTA